MNTLDRFTATQQLIETGEARFTAPSSEVPAIRKEILKTFGMRVCFDVKSAYDLSIVKASLIDRHLMKAY